MNSNRVGTEPASFFVPICLGVVTQMFCAGLVTAVTVIGFSPRSPMDSDSQTPDQIIDDQFGSIVVESTDKSTMAIEGDATAPTDVAPPALSDIAATDATPADSRPPADATPEDTPPAAAAARPLNDVRTRSRLLKIAGEGVPDEIELCMISVTDVAQVNLELIGEEFSEPQPVTIQLDRQPIDGNSCRWNVKEIAASGFDRTQEVGVFSLTNQKFGFRWLKNANKGKLPFCKLKISTNSDSEVCDLWSPVGYPAMKVSFNNATQKISQFVPPGIQLPPVESLRLKLTLEEWPEHESATDTLKLGDIKEITIPQEDTDGDLLKMLLTFKADGGQLALHVSHFTSVPKISLTKVKGVIDVKAEKKPLSHSEREKLSKSTGKDVIKCQKELEDIDKKLETLQTQLDELDAKPVFQQNPAERQNLEKRQSEREAERTVAEEKSTVYTGANDALTKLASLCEEIEGKGRIHFQLIRLLSGDDVGTDIVISSSENINPAQPVREAQ